MPDNKRYYWLKLKRDFFKRHDIQIVESMPNGKDYVLFYLKLLVESIDHEGELRFNDVIPYDDQMLSVITNTNIDIVRSALKIFSQLNLMSIFDDQTIYMTEVQRLIGGESWSAERVRKHRNSKLLQCNNDVTSCNVEIDKDKEIEIDKDKEIEKDSRTRKRFIKPSIEEITQYCSERSNSVSPQKFYDYYESNGWKVGRNAMKDWRATVRTWEQNGKKTGKAGRWDDFDTE